MPFFDCALALRVIWKRHRCTCYSTQGIRKWLKTIHESIVKHPLIRSDSESIDIISVGNMVAAGATKLILPFTKLSAGCLSAGTPCAGYDPEHMAYILQAIVVGVWRKMCESTRGCCQCTFCRPLSSVCDTQCVRMRGGVVNVHSAGHCSRYVTHDVGERERVWSMGSMIVDVLLCNNLSRVRCSIVCRSFPCVFAFSYQSVHWSAVKVSIAVQKQPVWYVIGIDR